MAIHIFIWVASPQARNDNLCSKQMLEFEEQVLKGLQSCGINLKALSSQNACIGATVSGGADSVSLMYALAELCKTAGVPLKVITVNHFIRPDAQTCADAAFVVEQCRLLKEQGYNIEVTVHELARGQVAALAQQKGIGIEAAARELRYQAFDTFIQNKNLFCLCLAHNKNDQTETLLMRFLQGAGGAASCGIPCVRQKYVRPLLWTDRSAIEAYLNSKKIKWCNDSTNTDTDLLRNKIRHRLVPFLNSNFYGWDTAVQNGAQQARDDSAFIDAYAKEYFENSAKFSDSNKTQISFAAGDFYPLPAAIKTRLLLSAANALGVECRISYVFLRDICNFADNYNKPDFQKKGGGKAVKSFADFSVIFENTQVLIKKCAQIQNEIVFSAIIEHGGVYEFPWGRIEVPGDFDFPLMLRSWRSDDYIQTADGGHKKVSDVLSSLHVSQSLRPYIPVVQAITEPEQKILAVLGSCQGYKDWIVKNEKI